MMSKPGYRLTTLLAAILVLAAPSLAMADFEQAVSYFKAGKYVEAAAEFQSLVDQSPSYDYGHYMLGLSFMKMDKPGDAEQSFGKAIELNGDRFEYHHGLAQTYYQRKQFGKAVGALKTAEGLAADGKTQYALYQLRGFSYSGLEKWSDSIEDLERARKIKSSPAVLDRLGQAYYNLNHYDKAVPVLRETLKAAPNNVANLSRLCNSLMNMGAEAGDDATKARLYGEALTVAEKFQKLEPSNHETHNLVGRAALGAKNYPKAVQAFSHVLAKKEDHCYAMVNLGKTYIAQENWSEAESILKDAAKCAPRMAVIYESLGFIVQKQKRLEEAIQYYEQAYAIKPSKSVQGMLNNAKKNLEIAQANQGMDEEERRIAEAEAKAQAEYEAALAKQKEWEKKTEDD